MHADRYFSSLISDMHKLFCNMHDVLFFSCDFCDQGRHCSDERVQNCGIGVRWSGQVCPYCSIRSGKDQQQYVRGAAEVTSACTNAGGGEVKYDRTNGVDL